MARDFDDEHESSIDVAFSRRPSSSSSFSDPATTEMIWSRMFPTATPLELLDYAKPG